MKWIKKNKSLINNILIFLLIFVISFIVFSFIVPVWFDQVWSYGFSYNISKGLIIYRDFNVVQMPLYFILASVFIKLFGNYMITTCIIDSLILSGIIFIIFKTIGWKVIFPFIIFIVFPPSPYNLLSMFLLFIILYLIDKDKYNGILVALIVGFVFITKQNLGVLLFIPMFFYSKNKIKSLLMFIIPFLVISIFFLCNNALFDFIDYVFLGLFNFGNNNDIDYFFLILELICFSYLSYYLVKSKFKDKEAFYVLAFQLVLYPLCEIRHFFVAFVPFLYYFLKTCRCNVIVLIVCTIEVLYISFAFYYTVLPIDIHTKKDLLFLRNASSISYYLDDINKEFNGEIDNIYFDSDYSYLYKLYFNRNPNRLDFILDGNMGYYSEKKIFTELDNHCKKDKCIFLLYKSVDSKNQYNGYRKFIKKHYKKIGDYKELDVYYSK